MTKIKQDIPIGANLQFLRKRAGLTQEAVATKLQLLGHKAISRKIISEIEVNDYSIRVSVLISLKEIYGASYEDIFESSDLRS